MISKKKKKEGGKKLNQCCSNCTQMLSLFLQGCCAPSCWQGFKFLGRVEAYGTHFHWVDQLCSLHVQGAFSWQVAEALGTLFVGNIFAASFSHP